MVCFSIIFYNKLINIFIVINISLKILKVEYYILFCIFIRDNLLKQIIFFYFRYTHI